MSSLLRRRSSKSHTRSGRSASPFLDHHKKKKDLNVKSRSPNDETDSGTTLSSSISSNTIKSNIEGKGILRIETRYASPFRSKKVEKKQSKKKKKLSRLSYDSKMESSYIKNNPDSQTQAAKNPFHNDSSKRLRSFSPFRRRRKESENILEKKDARKTGAVAIGRNKSESKKNPTTKQTHIAPTINKSKRNQDVNIRSQLPPPKSIGIRNPSLSRNKTMKKENSRKRLDRPSRKRINRNLKAEIDKGLSKTISFESIMVYPPSKISIQSRGHEDISLQSLKEPTVSCREKEIKIADYVHDIYHCVLDELREEIDQKKHLEVKEGQGSSMDKGEKDYGPPRRRSERRNLDDKYRFAFEPHLYKPTSMQEEVRDEPHAQHDNGGGKSTAKTRNKEEVTTTPTTRSTAAAAIISTSTCTAGTTIIFGTRSKTVSRLEHSNLIKNQLTPRDQLLLVNTLKESSLKKPSNQEGYDDKKPPLPFIEVPLRNASNEKKDSTSLDTGYTRNKDKNTVKQTTNRNEKRHFSPLQQKSRRKQIKAVKRMSSTKSKSIRRLFKSQQHDDRPSKTKLQERRRNFTFMKSPSRRKISSAAMEKTRARAKQLAEFAGTPKGKQSQEHIQAMEDSMFAHTTYENDRIAPVGLNFDALDTESVVSGMTSVYDMDMFDDQSILSSTSNFSTMRNKPSKSRKNRLSSFNSSSRRRQPQNSMNMFESETVNQFNNAFHPITMKNRLSTQSNQYAGSEAGSAAASFGGQTSRRRQRNTYSSGSSVVSTSSTVSGAAARRLMRRTKNFSQSQHQSYANNSTCGGSVGASVASEADSQSTGFEDSTERDSHGHERIQHQTQDSTSSKAFYTPRNGNYQAGSSDHWGRSIEYGLTFDAFGLDENQIDDDVNAALAELAETNPDISMFMNAGNDESRSTTTSFSTPSKQQSLNIAEDNDLKDIGMETSVASTSTKSFNSTLHSINKVPNTDENRIRIKKDEICFKKTSISGASEIGRRNAVTLRNVKDRMKSKSGNNLVTSGDLPLLGNKFQTMKLPDVGSKDTEDSNSVVLQSDQSDGSSFNQLSENPSDELQGAHAPPSMIIDQSTSCSEETVSSHQEPAHFIPRQNCTPQHGHLSESQRRAQSWASERNAPILISPLLVPSPICSKKKTTSSQKRAKAWAGACPESPGVMNRAPPLKAEEEEQKKKNGDVGHSPLDSFQVDKSTCRYNSPKWKHSEVHRSAHNHLADTSDNFEGSLSSDSVDPDDHEVESINILPSTTKPVHQTIGQRLPMPTEKVTLRRTESPVFQPDYEIFKTTAPKVTLRKVQPNSSKSPQESPNFLSNIKLKKVNIPAPRVEHDKMRSSQFKQASDLRIDEDSKYEQDKGIEDENLPELKENFAIITHQHQPPQPAQEELAEEITSSASISDTTPQKTYTTKSSTSSEKHSRACHQVPTRPSRNSSRLIEESVSIQKKASVLETDGVKSPLQTSVLKEKVTNPVAALFAHRASQSLQLKKNVEQVPDPTDLSAQILASPASPISSQIISRSESIGGPEDEGEDCSGKDEKQPPSNNIAALFAQRSAMMNSSPPARATIETDNKKMLESFSQRSTITVQQSTLQGDTVVMPGPKLKPTGNNDKVALKDDPKFAKYFKMLKMGLPMGAVKNAMMRDGLDPNIMEGSHNEPAGGRKSGIALKDDPKFAKYFKMLKMGLPMGAVKNAMERDGEDPNIMDGDHNAPSESDSAQEIEKTQPLPKDKYRRTRVHWDTLRQVKSTSVWALVNQDPDVEEIEIDESEFAQLFQAEAGKIQAVDSNSKKSNAVKVIDPKRANNGGIVLARLKITYEEMAVAIDTINDKVMTIEQVQGILEYIPTKDEKQSLRKYMTGSDKDSADAFDELCECEKFMVAMMTVKHSREKVRALLFKLQFRQCVSDLESDVTLVENACEELKRSVSLRKLLGIVLNIGNRLNTAGPTRKGKAGAFAIESLLKLNQAKAFDKKTTFLHYIVLIVLRHNATLTNFKDDLPSVLKADKIYWDQIETDLEEVENQLENVRKIALHEVFGKRRHSLSRKKGKSEEDDMSQDSMSLEEEVEALRSTKIGIFTLQAIKIVSALRESVEITRSKFHKALEYFGEDENKKMNPHELFEIICAFTKDFNIAKEEVLNLEKEKAKQNEKKQSESSIAAGRDSNKNKTSKRPSNPRRTEKPLRASSMQPHLNAIIMNQPKNAETKNGSELTDTPIPNDSSLTDFGIPARIKSCQAEDPEISSKSNTSVKSYSTYPSSSYDSNPFEEAQVVMANEKVTSDDSREECDENMPSPFSVNGRNHSQSEEDTSPLQVVENMSSSHFQSKSPPNKINANEARQSDAQSSPQSVRQKARSMRQQRMRSARQFAPHESSPPANKNRRRPPTPESGGRPAKYLTSEGEEARLSQSHDRVLSRRERLLRRQKNSGF